MASLFHGLVYQPIYNALAFLIGAIPGGDVGIALIALTLLIRLVLFPLSLASIRTQISMRAIDPKLRALREQYKDDKEGLAKATMTLFKENKVNPFASFVFILIQLPIIIGLYIVLRGESKTVSFDPSVLYSFVHAPAHASLVFLGLVNLAGKSIVFALLVAVTQYFYARLMAPSAPPKPASGATPTFQDDLARSMNMQMRYVYPVILALIAYFASAAVALYFIVSNSFSIAQELFVRKIHRPVVPDVTPPA